MSDAYQIAQLEAEVSRLREVLAPFDRMAGELFCRNWNDSDVVFAVHQNPYRRAFHEMILTAKHFFEVRRVLAALSPTSNGGDTDGRP